MARMLCRIEDCDNEGEKEFYRACEANLGDEIVVYHNRVLDGLVFDFCLLIPEYGTLIVEVKGWNKETLKQIHNGKMIIKVEDKTKEQDPFKQAKIYKNAMENLFQNRLGRTPLIERCVCFTRWEDEFLKRPDIIAYMGHTDRLLMGKDDINDPERFTKKIKDCFLPSLRESNFFSDEEMIKVMDFFDPGYAREMLNKAREQNPITAEGRRAPTNEEATEEVPSAKEIPPYSIVTIVPAGAVDQVDRLVKYYGQGTKITAVFCGMDLQERAAEKLTALYQEYSIIPDGSEKLKMSPDKVQIAPAVHLRFFNWNSHVIEADDELASSELFVVDGQLQGKDHSILEIIDRKGMMNLAQYEVEHEDDRKHILVRAGAGTGKTAVMIDRISYLIYRQQMASGELRDRIMMITFTDAAAENMSKRLKKRFQNLYLLTGHGDYLSMVGQVNQMQISTIHSYALQLIKDLCVFSGFSSELAVESGEFNRRRFLRDSLEQTIQEKLKSDKGYIAKLGIPLYEIREKLLRFVGALENKSIDLKDLDKASFGYSTDNPVLHELFMEVIPKSEKAYADELRENGKIFLGSLMPELVRAVKAGIENKRLSEDDLKRDRYLFVDEFQDTDDYQIQVILDIVEALKYHLFCVGDQKQCIYRFRGAEEQAFDKLKIEEDPSAWKMHSLIHNYRTDNELLEAFDPYFGKWGAMNLLLYDPALDRLDDPIHSNGHEIPYKEYMHRIIVKDKDAVLPALFEEVQKRIRTIEENPELHQNEEDRLIAILVRENWQARDVLEYARQNFGRELVVETETGGDLFQSDPALDMLTLCQALQQDDPAVLSHFAESNFIGATVNKAKMYQLKKKPLQPGQKPPQVEYLQGLINQRLESTATEDECKSLDEIRAKLRMMPIMQVLHQLYMQLMPWDLALDDQLYRLNVDELFERFVRSGTGAGTNLDQLTAYLSNCIFSKKEAESRSVEETDQKNAVVKCLTVHKSKGLEYGYVILPFTDLSINRLKRTGMDVIIREDNHIGYNFKVSDGVTMHNNYFDEKEEKTEKQKEETRVLYVAMTRSRKGFSWIELENNKKVSWQSLLKGGEDE